MVLGVGRTHKGPTARLKGLDHTNNSAAFEGLAAEELPHLWICREDLAADSQEASREAGPGWEEQGFCSKTHRDRELSALLEPGWKASSSCR